MGAGLRGGYHTWLRALLRLLQGAQSEAVRLPLLGALLSYLLLARAGSLSALPSPVLSALLEGGTPQAFVSRQQCCMLNGWLAFIVRSWHTYRLTKKGAEQGRAPG